MACRSPRDSRGIRYARCVPLHCYLSRTTWTDPRVVRPVDHLGDEHDGHTRVSAMACLPIVDIGSYSWKRRPFSIVVQNAWERPHFEFLLFCRLFVLPIVDFSSMLLAKQKPRLPALKECTRWNFCLRRRVWRLHPSTRLILPGHARVFWSSAM